MTRTVIPLGLVVLVGFCVGLALGCEERPLAESDRLLASGDALTRKLPRHPPSLRDRHATSYIELLGGVETSSLRARPAETGAR